MSNHPNHLDMWYKHGTFNYLTLYGETRDNPWDGWLYCDEGSIITRAINTSDITNYGYYGTQTIDIDSSASVSVVTAAVDHGGLAGLSDDDHPQYGLRSGNNIWGGTNQFDSTVTVNALLTASDGTITNNLTVDNDLYVTEDIYVGDKIYHISDEDTFISFVNNAFHMYAGGGDIANFTTTAFRVNPDGNMGGDDVDLRCHGVWLENLFHVDAGEHEVNIKGDLHVTNGNIDVSGSLAGSTASFTGNITSDATLYGSECSVTGKFSGPTLMNVDDLEVYSDDGILIMGKPGDIELGDSTERLMYPSTDLKINLGSRSYRFNECYFSEASIGDTDNYSQFSSTGTLTFVGNGGLAFGEIWAHSASATTTSESQNDWNQIVAFDTNGESNDMTPDHANNYITVLKTGKYLCSFHWCGHGPATVHDWDFHISKNDSSATFNNVTAHVTSPTTQKDTSVSATGIIALTADDTVEMWVKRTSSGNNIVLTTDNCNITLTQIGG